MKEINPKVSIIMGIYNCEDTLAESIESIIDQTYIYWELIICDDCSNDNTLEVAEKYSDRYPDKIKLLKNEKNLTLGPTLNKCLEYASGEYIARQDADDISHKERLEKQIDFFRNDKEYSLVGTSMITFDEKAETGNRRTTEIPEAKDMMYGSVFAHATIMIKADCIKKLEGYSNNLNRRGVEDYDLWFRFFEKGYKGYNMQESLYYVREDSEAYKRKNYKRRKNEILTMLDGRKVLGLDFKYSLCIIKPLIALLTPNWMLMKYHKSK